MKLCMRDGCGKQHNFLTTDEKVNGIHKISALLGWKGEVCLCSESIIDNSEQTSIFMLLSYVIIHES